MNVELSNGVKLPCICYGTDIVSDVFFEENYIKRIYRKNKYLFQSVSNGQFKQYIRERHLKECTGWYAQNGLGFFDTSRAYAGSEKMLNKCLKNKPRQSYYICTKLCNYHQLNGISARQALEESLLYLGTDYVDVYLLHWPVDNSYLDYWKQLEELYEEGLVRAIGVCNCKVHHLEEIKKVAKIMPQINEVELHPLLTEKELREYCHNNGIQIMAYTATARMDFRLRESSRMRKLCDEYNKSLPQIMMRWHIQNGIIPIFNSTSIKHIKENIEVFDFELSEESMRIIEGMNINSRTRYDSDNCEFERL